MYSLSVSHILLKLVLMLVRFPESIFVLKIVVLLLFYSFTLILGCFIILTKLLQDFAKHRKLTSKYLEMYKEYYKLSNDYQVCLGKMENDQENTKRKQNKEVTRFALPQLRTKKFKTFELSKQKLMLIRLKITELQI